MTALPLLLALGAGVASLVLVGPRAHHRPVSRINGLPDGPDSAVPGWFGGVVRSLDLTVDPALAWAAVVLVGAGGAVWAVVEAPAAAAVVAILGASGRGVVRWARRRVVRSGIGDDALLELVVAARASLTSGASLTGALGAAGAAGPVAAQELGPVLAAVRAGGAVQPALDRWAEERAGTGVGLVVDALAIAGATGASQARALGAVAETLSDRRARAREVRALASQARASAVALVALPAVFAVLVSVSDPAVARFTTGTPAGWACIAGGLLLDAAGAWWMAALVRGVR